MGFINASPSAPFLANLFGIETIPRKQGGFKLGGQTGGGLFGDQALTDISSYLTSVKNE